MTLPTPRKPKRNRGHLPPHLPRVERVIEPASTQCPCGCGEMTKIGEDVSERLDVIPAQFRVLVTRRPKYACRRCSQAVAQAHAPEHVAPGGLPTELFIARIIVAKFGDHLPFYRQADIFKRQGLDLDRGTLGNWVGRACFHLMPVINHMRAHLRGADRIFVDETRAPVLDPGRMATRSGFFWAVVSDDRGHGGVDPPIVLFPYAPGRGKEHPLKFLAGYQGRFLQCDACQFHNALTEIARDNGPWRLVYCWTHVRRRFVKRFENEGSPIAEEMLRQIALLYQVEKSVRGQDAAVRLAARREHAGPVITALKPWLEAQLSRIPQKSQLAEDIRHTLAHWTGLIRFLDDGALGSDTNPVESQIRPIALTRKNALFAGNEIGAENWAMLASLAATCKMADVNPVDYSAATLSAILDGGSRGAAARTGGVGLQVIRDWVVRFNAGGPESLATRKASGKRPILTAEQRAALAATVEAGPRPCLDGVAHRRLVGLAQWAHEELGVSVMRAVLRPEGVTGAVEPRTARRRQAP